MNRNSSKRSGVQELRARVREETARAILDAAENSFAKHGVEKTHVADIATRAGVAVGTLYNYFRDRDDLLEALLTRRRSAMVQILDEVLQELVAAPFRAQLLATMRRLLTDYDEHKEFWQALLRGDLGPTPAQTKMHALCAITERLETLAARGCAEGTLRPELTGLFPWLLIGALRGLNLHEMKAPLPGGLPAQAELLTDFLLNGAGISAAARAVADEGAAKSRRPARRASRAGELTRGGRP